MKKTNAWINKDAIAFAKKRTVEEKEFPTLTEFWRLGEERYRHTV